MPSASIHFFSGTGNTAYAASFLGGCLESAGFAVTTHRIVHGAEPPATEKSPDLWIVAFPVYSLEAPEMVLRYCRRMAPGRGARAAVVATIGKLYSTKKVAGDSGYEGGALEHMRKILEKRGYRVVFTDAVSFPSNVTLVRLCAAAEEVPGILSLAEDHLTRIADALVHGSISVKRYPPLVPRIWMILATLYRSVGRRSIGKMFVADRTCTSCGACEKACPAQAIRMVGGRPRWTYGCEGCHRCINTCPRGAIQGSALRALTMILLVFAPYGAVAAGGLALLGIQVPAGGWEGLFYGLGAWLAGYTVSFVLLDIVYSALERPPLDFSLVTAGYTRGAFRYSAEHCTSKDSSRRG